MQQLAFYLHDSVLSPLGAAVTRLEQAEDELGDECPTSTRELIRGTAALVRRKYEQVRRELPLLADGLIPVAEATDLTSQWLRCFFTDLCLDARFEGLPLLDHLVTDEGAELRLLLSELIANIIKHDRPTAFSFSVAYRRPELVIRLRHDSPRSPYAPSGRGLGSRTIPQRLERLRASHRTWTVARITTQLVTFQPVQPATAQTAQTRYPQAS